MKLPDIALAALATLRLSRLLTSDSISGWTIDAPVFDWAETNEQVKRDARALVLDMPKDFDKSRALQVFRGRWQRELESDAPLSWQKRLASGLHCPFCVGFWLGGAVLGSYAVARRSPRALALWRAGAAPLALNYVVGHVASRLD